MILLLGRSFRRASIGRVADLNRFLDPGGGLPDGIGGVGRGFLGRLHGGGKGFGCLIQSLGCGFDGGLGGSRHASRDVGCGFVGGFLRGFEGIGIVIKPEAPYSKICDEE